MFYHLILGLLRDGRARHGYDLMREYRAKAGQSVNPGNFYRECNKLLSTALITPDAKPPEADARRIPYRITPGGCRDFDDWLTQPSTLGSNLSTWLIFADMLPASERLRLIGHMQAELWVESKKLTAARERLAARSRPFPSPTYQPAALLALRRIKQIAADLEFLQELRDQLERLPCGVVAARPGNGAAEPGWPPQRIDPGVPRSRS
jgi:DNA-binding PadR family transcriptional regulator